MVLGNAPAFPMPLAFSGAMRPRARVLSSLFAGPHSLNQKAMRGYAPMRIKLSLRGDLE
jgi:hypothetical protein